MKKVTIVVPVYNVSEFLNECIDSLVSQTYVNLEIILINDGSTDKSGSICDDYACKDDRIRVIHQTNKGVSSARNAGINTASGEWIMFVDGDDILTPHAIKNLVTIASQTNADCTAGMIRAFIDETDLQPVHGDPRTTFKVVTGQKALEHMLYQQHIVNGPVAKLYKSNLIKNIKFKIGITIAEDLYFNYQVLKNAKAVAITSSLTYLYRLREGSASRYTFNHKRMDGLKVTELILKDAKKSKNAIKPARDRLFMESVFIGSQIIYNAQYRNEYKLCKKNMRKYCIQIVGDRNAPTIHRLIAAASIISAYLTLYIFNYRTNERVGRRLKAIDPYKKVLIRFYNSKNLGDDLFVKIITQRYQNTFTISKNRHNLSLSRIENLMNAGNRITNKIIHYIEKISKKNNLVLSRLARKNDLLVYIGGSIFIEGSDIQRWCAEKQFYHDLKLPYYIIGSNIGPYTSNEFLPIVKNILAEATDVCLRDNASHKLVNALPNIRVSTDIAFTLKTNLYDIKQEKTAIFSLIDGIRKFDTNTTEQYEATVRTLTTRLVADGYRVIYMSFCEYEGDEMANKRVRLGLSQDIYAKVEEFNYHGNLDEVLSLIASSEIIIASRFHATVLGLVFGKKVLPIAYSDKTTNILTDMAFPGTVVDIRKINEFDPMTFDFNTIPIMDVAEQRALAETQFQELDKVLVKKVTDA